MKLKLYVLAVIGLISGRDNAQVEFTLPKMQSEIAYFNVRNPLILEARGSQVIQNVWAQDGIIDTINERVFFTPLSYRSKIFFSYLVDGKILTDSIRPRVKPIKLEEILISFKPRLFHFNVFGKPLKPKKVLATLPREKYGHLDPKLQVFVESFSIEVHDTTGEVKVFKLNCEESGEIKEDQEYQAMLKVYSSDGIKLRVSSVYVYAEFWPNSEEEPIKIKSPQLFRVDPSLFLMDKY